MLPITDPANLSEDSPPAVQAAAAIKQEEDAAPQKIMAIRYLATLGCGGCYEKVEDALLEGLSDCTEEVRFEAVKALQCKPDCGCKYCSSPSCCSDKVRKKLEELTTCEKEPSARVRRVARMALACCATKPLKESETVPREGPPSILKEDGEGALTKVSRSKLFDGVQLVQFQTSAKKDGPDMLLAQVNGEPIYESQIKELLDAQDRTSTQTEPRVRLATELQKVIHWKIVEQCARREISLASTAATSTVSAYEMQSWFTRHVHVEDYVSALELNAYYELHADRFRLPPKARWEEVSLYFSDFKSKEDALKAAEFLRAKAAGVPATAPEGFEPSKVDVQVFPWTEYMKTESADLVHQIRTLPLGATSVALVEPDRLALIRVLERQDSTRPPLAQVAESLKAEILQERVATAEKKLMNYLRTQSQVWTVFDSGNQRSPETGVGDQSQPLPSR